MRLGSEIGRPIRIDDATSLASRGLYARMCIEIDISKPLQAKFKLRKRVRKIEYEGIHLICFQCGVYGHHQENCKKDKGREEAAEKMEHKDKTTNQENDVRYDGENNTRTEEEENTIPKEKDNFGPWMIAPKRVRRGSRGRGRGTNLSSGTIQGERNINKAPIQGGSRFTVIEVDDDGMEFGNGQEETTSQETREEETQPKPNRTDHLNIQMEKKHKPKGRKEMLSIASPREKRPTTAMDSDPELRRKKPKQAAAESEHTVVTSTNRGHTIDRYTVRNDTNISLLQGIPDLEYYEHHNDPPEARTREESKRINEDTTIRSTSSSEIIDQGEVPVTH